MKKNARLNIALLSALLISLVSCKKYLDVEPTDFLSPSQYYSTEGQLNTALTGVYDILGRAGTYQSYYYSFLSSVSDVEYYRVSSPGATNPLLFNELPSDPYVTACWNTLYDGVNRANALLDNIDRAAVDSTVKKSIKAQAMFLRGYYYFLLVSNWGEVPLRLTATKSTADANCPRSSIKTIYEQILKDMTTAEAALQTPAKVGSAAGIRVTNTVAAGILARVCLTMAGEPLKDVSKFADAKKWAGKVINSGFHTLNPDYRQIFINHCADIIEPKECLWEVDFYRIPSNGSEWGTNGSANSINFRNIDYGLSYGQYALTKKYWDYANTIPNDLRRDWNMAPFNLSGATTGLTGIIKTAIGTTTANIWSRYEGKWRREFETYTPKASGATSINWPILRYADVLLMFAEAENELNGATDSAYKAINLVRERAQGIGYRITGFTVTNAGSGYTTAPTVTISSPTQGNGATATATVSGGKITGVTISNIGGNGAFYTAAPTITLDGSNGTGAIITPILQAIVPASADLTTGMSQDAFRQAVRDERAVELSGEALRKHDLIRWGTLVSSMKALSAYIRADAAVISGFQYAAIPGDNVSSKDIFLPIPTSELTLNKALNNQNNPGY